MTREEFARNFAEKIEIERIRLGYTQARMAKELQISLSTYKNIITGISQNIPIYLAHLVYQVTGKSYFELCSDVIPELALFVDFQGLPDYKQRMVRTLAYLELQLWDQEKVQENGEGEAEEYIMVYAPTGTKEGVMYYDPFSVEEVPVGKYQKLCKNQIDCGLKITNDSLCPVYHQDDILLVQHKSPMDGDTGIFIKKDTKRLCFRRFRQRDPERLEALVPGDEGIDVDGGGKKEWMFFGRVLMKIRRE